MVALRQRCAACRTCARWAAGWASGRCRARVLGHWHAACRLRHATVQAAKPCRHLPSLLLQLDLCITCRLCTVCIRAPSPCTLAHSIFHSCSPCQVDLTSCPVGAATLRVLGQCCPAVEQLRLGSRVTDETAGRWVAVALRCFARLVSAAHASHACLAACILQGCAKCTVPQGYHFLPATSHRCSLASLVPVLCRGLKDILPALEQRHQAPAAESWDTLLEVDDAAQLTAAVAGAGRLMQLQCVHWPSVPFRLAEHCKTACPQVALNPSAEEVARRRLPAACDPAAELDAPRLAGKAWAGQGCAVGLAWLVLADVAAVADLIRAMCGVLSCTT